VSQQLRCSKLLAGFLLLGLGVALVVASWSRPAFGRNSGNADSRVIARGGGTTIIHGGTGAPGFVPVFTTIAFHAEQSDQGISGSFECLAKAPQSPTGPNSAEFTVNAMYVTGQITGAVIHGNIATFTGTATITGLGAGSNVPFSFVVQRGGPGTASALTVSTQPSITFNEILVEGTYELEPES